MVGDGTTQIARHAETEREPSDIGACAYVGARPLLGSPVELLTSLMSRVHMLTLIAAILHDESIHRHGLEYPTERHVRRKGNLGGGTSTLR